MSYNGKGLFNGVAKKFYEDNGKDAVPVTSNLEYEAVEKAEMGKPIIVTSEIAQILRSDRIDEQRKVIKITSVKEQLELFVEKIADRLSDEELDEINSLIEKVNN